MTATIHVIVLWILYIIAGGISVTSTPLQAVEDRYDYIRYNERLDNRTKSPVIRAHHVPQSPNRYDLQPIRYFDHRLNNLKKHYYHRRKSNDKTVYGKSIKNEISPWDSSEKKVLTTGIFRTYGKGKARIPRVGASVNVPKTSGHKKAHKGTITTRLVTPDDSDSSDTKKPLRSRRACSGCPDDHVVVATKGKTFVLLPEPCPTLKWTSISGPRPGTKLREGRHTIIGRFGHRRKVCEYHYQVIVRHCTPLEDEDLEISCTADDAWGSKCSMSCGKNRKLTGNSATECTDNLSWSHPLPKCETKRGCDVPGVPDGSMLSCHTANQSDVDRDAFAEGSYCRFRRNEQDTVIRCKNGGWIRADLTLDFQTLDDENLKSDNEQYKYLIGNDDDNELEAAKDVCMPNPCHNGGTCLRPAKNHERPVCLCTRSTRGPRCEFKQCEMNICEHNGQCLIRNDKTMCYCLPGYSGSRCEINLETQE